MHRLHFSFAKLIILALTGLLVVACGMAPVKKVTPAQGDDESPVDVSLPVVEKAVEPSAPPEPTIEERFLAKAEVALSKGRLTSPAYDNAYDRFQAVLMIDPDNAAAKAGLQAVVIQYAELIRTAMAASQYVRANELMILAKAYYPQNALLEQLQRDLASISTVRPQVVTAKPARTLPLEEIALDAHLFNGDRGELITLLGRLAQRVRDTNETVMIYASTDAEGRWIYKQLKKAVPGYRVRGDIRLSSRARIAILPPL